MSSELDIASDVTQFIRRTFLFNDSTPVSEDRSLLGAGIIDSTGILELIDYLEAQYGMKFGDNELVAENFDSISRISQFMFQKLNQTAPSDTV